MLAGNVETNPGSTVYGKCVVHTVASLPQTFKDNKNTALGVTLPLRVHQKQS